MKAAIVTAAGKTPVYGEFHEPVAKDGEELISVRAASLSNLTTPLPRAHCDLGDASENSAE
jgi:hypothetical protein